MSEYPVLNRRTLVRFHRVKVRHFISAALLIELEFRKSANTSMAPILLVACLALTMVVGSQTLFPSAATQSYNNVQIFITTQNADDNSFLISAYNSTGGLVATSQSGYPALSLELPSGTYLFTVVASQPYWYGSPGPLAAAQPSSAIFYPISSSPAEYGYSLVQLSNSNTIDITTTPISDLKATQISVHVNYLNGTAASDASVGASIVGGWYWIYQNNIVLSNQTDKNGVATLTVPSVPVEVTSWKWVPIALPKNETTTQVSVGGQMVNVTVYWQPTYIGLAGEALIIPPQTNADIVLHGQQPTYWIMPYGVATPQTATAASGSALFANSPGGIPANQYTQVSGSAGALPVVTQTISNQIPPLPTSTTQSNSSISGSSLLLGIGLVISLVVAATALIIATKKK